MANQPTSFRYPYQHPDRHTNNGFRLLFQGNKDLNDAIVALNSKVAKTASQITNQVNESINNVVNNISGTTLPVAVTEQTSDYMLQQGDFGGLNYFTGVGPYVLTLNNSIARPFFSSVLNSSTGIVTVTAVSPSFVNGLATILLLPNQWIILFWDGVLWWALLGPILDVDALITTGAVNTPYNLPDNATFVGASYFVKKFDSGAGIVQVTPAGTDTIEGMTEYDLINQWQYLKVKSKGDGTWFITANN